MRKLLLLTAFAAFFLCSFAQQALLRSNKWQMLTKETSPVVLPTNHSVVTPGASHHQLRSSRSSVLNSQRIGSAGNLFSVLNNGTNCLDADDALGTVMFIHRMDGTMFPSFNLSMYTADRSKDRGITWSNDSIGSITNDPANLNSTVNGRYPQGVIFNQNATTNPDSEYLVYTGSWHDGATGSWQGELRGRGRLSMDTSTYNFHEDVVNGGNTTVGTGMCKGAPGVFWNINENNNGTFATGSPSITSGFVVEKGVWNNGTGDVDWTESLINQTFSSFDNAGAEFSAVSGVSIAFDPSGQKGWVACLCDLSADADSVYDPVFWKTTNGGATWSGPIWIDLDSLADVMTDLPTHYLVDTTIATTHNPTSSFELDLSVDVNGNPHLLTTVGTGSGYAIEPAGYNAYDITFDTAYCGTYNGWKAIHLDHVFLLRGNMDVDNPVTTQDNRPQVSRSPDGHKIFFFWVVSDTAYMSSLSTPVNNDAPNLMGRALDVITRKMTPVYNFTLGDSLWGGPTLTVPAGALQQGATFPCIGQNCLVNGSTYNVPVVLSQIDYAHDPANGLGSSSVSAAFWYINNINVPASDFYIGVQRPAITLIGSDTVYVPIHSAYIDSGATATECGSAVNVTMVNLPDTSTSGTYIELYIATDGMGNSDTVTRTIIVFAAIPPVAAFTWSFPNFPYVAQFQDQSTNVPTSWSWTFGDGGISAQQSPQHIYASNGIKHVCLTACNNFGCDSVCHDVTITGVVGINEVAFAQQISMFPNPTNGKVNITLQGNAIPEFNVSVYNMLGETMMAPVKYKAGTTNVEMNLGSVASGVYLVKIQSDKGVAVKHLIITH